GATGTRPLRLERKHQRRGVDLELGVVGVVFDRPLAEQGAVEPDGPVEVRHVQRGVELDHRGGALGGPVRDRSGFGRHRRPPGRTSGVWPPAYLTSNTLSVTPPSDTSIVQGDLAGSAYWGLRSRFASSGDRVTFQDPGGTPSPCGYVRILNDPSSAS